MPFPGGITAEANGGLLFSLAAAVLYLAMLDRPVSLRRTIVKTMTVAILALIAWREGGPALLVAALALSAAGDAFLAHDGEKPFMAGLASFLAAHLAYVGLFVLNGFAAVALTAPRLALAGAIVGLALAMILKLRPAVGAALRLPVTLYGLAIGAMGLAALGIANPLVPLGAVAFMASDALLGGEKFLVAKGSPMSRPMRVAVWVLYVAGQMALMLGILA